jgi:hypothetical protein
LKESVSFEGEPNFILSVSDLGPHNLLKNTELGLVYCVDLEFFGWDDAHKLCIDTLMHPNVDWTKDLAWYFFERFRQLHELNDCRLLEMWNFISLKWGLIILTRLSGVIDDNSSRYSNDYKLGQAYEYISNFVTKVDSIPKLIELSASMSRDQKNFNK